MDASCPHCAAPNSGAAKFCTACGKAMPAAAPGSPRVLKQAYFAASSAGQSLQLDELRKQSRRAVLTLGWLAGIQLVIGGILLVVSQVAPPQARHEVLVLGAVLGCIGLAFTALAFWARRSPLPAAITGLVLFVSLWALDTTVLLMGDHPELAFRGAIVKLLIAAALGHAVSAALKHKALLRKMAGELPLSHRAAA